MPLSRQNTYTSEDYWNLPDDERAELIDGQLYDMAPPNRIHQKLIIQIGKTLVNYIDDHHGDCEVYPAPFAVNLDADDKNWVDPVVLKVQVLFPLRSETLENVEFSRVFALFEALTVND